nr:hypothetical protein [Gammaproteobacteria bacterium]
MQTQLKNNKNLIYDVGMCQGEDTAFYLKKGFTVIAFEANPELITQAKIKFARAFKILCQLIFYSFIISS